MMSTIDTSIDVQIATEGPGRFGRCESCSELRHIKRTRLEGERGQIEREWCDGCVKIAKAAIEMLYHL